jgi:hypothetical protein
MEELHTDSIDGGHEASYGARSRARERAYSNKNFSERVNNCSERIKILPITKEERKCFKKRASP